MPLLGVNVDHVATLRQQRGVGYPDPIAAALIAQKSGADSIVAHLREDRRHIQDADIYSLRKKLTIKFNMEMSIHPSVVKVAMKAKPDCVTLVPEKRKERTTESGLDVAGMKARLKPLVKRFAAKGIETSMFIDPNFKQIDASIDCGANAIELHTGDYANAGPKTVQKHLRDIRIAVEYAQAKGLMTHVGHGLDYSNVSAIAAIRGITEFNIGFSIISKAVETGLESAVKLMLRKINGRN